MGTSEKERWSEKDISDGNRLLAYIRKNIDTTRVANFGVQVIMAARAFQLLNNNQTYKDLRLSLRRYLESKSKESEEWRPSIEELETRWYETVDPDRLDEHDGELAERIRNNRGVH